jgi:F-type H+-transporting ATPase subunit b
MFDINPGLMIWSAAVFLLLLFVLTKFAWKPLIHSLEKREAHIRGSIEQSEQARQEAERLLAENRKELARAEEESRRIVNEGRALAEKLKTEIVEKANQQSRKMVEQAKLEIERDKEAAINQLRSEVASLAVLAAGKIIGETLDAGRHAKLVDDMLGRLPRN